MRSLLFVPGDSEKKLIKGYGSRTDVLIVDLEDSVSAENKEAARLTAAEFIAAHKGDGPQFYVRVNDLSTGLTDDDLTAIMKAAPVGIMLPKSNSLADVSLLGVKLRVYEAQYGLIDGSTKILPIITETPLGVLNAPTYAQGDQRLSGLTWGAEDLSAEIGAAETRAKDGAYTDVFRHARVVTLLAANSASTAAIDTVFPSFRDETAFRKDSEDSARDGFTGRMAIHPDQVEIINDVFTPSETDIAHATAIVTEFANAGNPGVVGINGKMYDRPHLKRAERLLERAKSAGIFHK